MGRTPSQQRMLDNIKAKKEARQRLKEQEKLRRQDSFERKENFREVMRATSQLLQDQGSVLQEKDVNQVENDEPQEKELKVVADDLSPDLDDDGGMDDDMPMVEAEDPLTQPQELDTQDASSEADQADTPAHDDEPEITKGGSETAAHVRAGMEEEEGLGEMRETQAPGSPMNRQTTHDSVMAVRAQSEAVDDDTMQDLDQEAHTLPSASDEVLEQTAPPLASSAPSSPTQPIHTSPANPIASSTKQPFQCPKLPMRGTGGVMPGPNTNRRRHGAWVDGVWWPHNHPNHPLRKTAKSARTGRRQSEQSMFSMTSSRFALSTSRKRRDRQPRTTDGFWKDGVWYPGQPGSYRRNQSKGVMKRRKTWHTIRRK